MLIRTSVRKKFETLQKCKHDFLLLCLEVGPLPGGHGDLVLALLGEAELATFEVVGQTEAYPVGDSTFHAAVRANELERGGVDEAAAKRVRRGVVEQDGRDRSRPEHLADDAPGIGLEDVTVERLQGQRVREQVEPAPWLSAFKRPLGSRSRRSATALWVRSIRMAQR